jgi:hypothetical protein
MNKNLIAVAGIAAVSSWATAAPLLQFDLNGFNTQSTDAGGRAVAFGGTSHTGRINLSKGTGNLAGLYSLNSIGGTQNNLGLATNTFSLSSFTGDINLTNGRVGGGNITVRLSNGDSFTTQIAAGTGSVTRFIGGGFIVQALTTRGFFNDNRFGNVDVSRWFNNQGNNGLAGSMIQFRFLPNGSGFSTADMDLFVDAVPLPPAAWAGLGTLALVGAYRRFRRGR